MIAFFFSLIVISSCSYTVAIFHGISDFCKRSGMENLEKIFSSQLNHSYTKCLETGGSSLDWFTSFESQAEKGCETIKADKNFHGEFSVVGISQGSLLARYIIEKCDMPGKVKRYVSIGGPQMGVAKLPHCESGLICNTVNKLIGKAVYSDLVQKHIGPSGYFKTNQDMETYLKYSTFLADLNNERSEKNESYKNRFLELEKVLLIKFTEDTMVIPRETSHFRFYNQENKIEELETTQFYKDDFIGVRQLVEENKIQFLDLEGEHLNFTQEDITKFMIPILQ
jgi:palmitoyl-protein thioesterase